MCSLYMMKNIYSYYIMKLILLFGKPAACNIIVLFDSFDFEEFILRVYIQWQQLQYTVTKIFFLKRKYADVREKHAN